MSDQTIATHVTQHEWLEPHEQKRAHALLPLTNVTTHGVPRAEGEVLLGDNSTYAGRHNPWASALGIRHVLGTPVDHEGRVGNPAKARGGKDRHYTIRPVHFPEDHESVCGLLREAVHSHTATDRGLDDPIDLQPFADSLGGAILMACLILVDGIDDTDQCLIQRAQSADRSRWHKGHEGQVGVSVDPEHYIPFEEIPRPLLEEVPVGIVCYSHPKTGDYVAAFAGTRIAVLHTCHISELHANLGLQEQLVHHALKTPRAQAYTKVVLDLQQMSAGPGNRFTNARFKQIDGERPDIVGMEL